MGLGCMVLHYGYLQPMCGLTQPRAHVFTVSVQGWGIVFFAKPGVTTQDSL